MTAVVGSLLLDEEDEEDEEDLPPVPHGLPHRFLRENARPYASACMAWHEALPPDTLAGLENDAAKLVMEESRTFWLDEDATPRCAVEKYALSVLAAHRRVIDTTCGQTVKCGVEWWVQHRRFNGTEPTIGLHWDTDEECKSQSGEHVPPFLATVTYLGNHGAPTLILPLAADKHGRSIEVPCGAFLSYPRSGKHLCFDGRLIHGAPHSLARSMPAGGTRTTILINIWVGHVPTGLTALDESLAARLCPVEHAASLRSLVTEVVHAVEPVGATYDGESGVALEETAVGYPFFHPPISVRWLPSPMLSPLGGTTHTDASLVHIGTAVLELRVGGSLEGQSSDSDVSSILARAPPALLDALSSSDAYNSPGAAWNAFSRLACLSHAHVAWVRAWRAGLRSVALDGGAISAAALTEVGRRCMELHSLTLGRSCDMSDPMLAAGHRWFHLQAGDADACKEIHDDAIVAIAAGCPRLTRLDLAGCTQLSGDAIGAVTKHCAALRDLDLSHCFVRRPAELTAAVTHLASGACAFSLTALDLTRSQLPEYDVPDYRWCLDHRLFHILIQGCPNLLILRLVNASNLSFESDEGQTRAMEAFGRLAALSLHTLDLFGCTALTQTDILSLAISHTPDDLHTLHLSACPGVYSWVLTTIASTCGNLRELRLYGCDNPIDDGLVALAKSCAHLEVFDLSMTNVGGDTVEHLCTTCDLTALWLFGCNRVRDDACLAPLATCSRLCVLDLSLIPAIISHTTLQSIATCCPALHTLALCGCVVEPGPNPHDPLWPIIGSMRALRRLDVCDVPAYERFECLHALVKAICKGCPLLSRLALTRLSSAEEEVSVAFGNMGLRGGRDDAGDEHESATVLAMRRSADGQLTFRTPPPVTLAATGRVQSGGAAAVDDDVIGIDANGIDHYDEEATEEAGQMGDTRLHVAVRRLLPWRPSTVDNPRE